RRESPPPTTHPMRWPLRPRERWRRAPATAAIDAKSVQLARSIRQFDRCADHLQGRAAEFGADRAERVHAMHGAIRPDNAVLGIEAAGLVDRVVERGAMHRAVIRMDRGEIIRPGE